MTATISFHIGLDCDAPPVVARDLTHSTVLCIGETSLHFYRTSEARECAVAMRAALDEIIAKLPAEGGKP